MSMSSPAATVRVATACLDDSVRFFVDEIGFAHHLVTPADAPQRVQLIGHGIRLELVAAEVSRPIELTIADERNPDERDPDERAMRVAPDGSTVMFIPDEADAPVGAAMSVPDAKPVLHLARRDDGQAGVGRAAMRYRDLLPDRWGGRFIASHIEIPDGGDVPDWVHYHRIRFQLIYVMAGWVDVVYEDQGPPFRMHAGDCVLQPPLIRHRVLRASPGLQVIEIGCPAEHDTLAEHAFDLPTAAVRPDRDFGGQRFVCHVAADQPPAPVDGLAGWTLRNSGIAAATADLAGVRVAHLDAEGAGAQLCVGPDSEFAAAIVVAGTITLNLDDGSAPGDPGRPDTETSNVALGSGDAAFLPPSTAARIRPTGDAQILLVDLAAGSLTLAPA